MEDKLTALREKNAGFPMYSVTDDAFRRFGRIVPFDASVLTAAAEKIAMPEMGCKYFPDLPALETAVELRRVRDEIRGQGDCQIGLCWGYNYSLNCLEYHLASEHNIAVTDLVLLLAARQDMEGFDLPADRVTGFFVRKGMVIEVYATTLHFTPCQVNDAGFQCIVVLPRGTNQPFRGIRPETGDGRLLWARDKWLIAHPASPHAARGAYPGVHGENLTLKY